MDFVILDSPNLEPDQYRKQYICRECLAGVKHRHPHKPIKKG